MFLVHLVNLLPFTSVTFVFSYYKYMAMYVYVLVCIGVCMCMCVRMCVFWCVLAQLLLLFRMNN